jgi:cellulose synthase operon protein YhjQ
MALICFASPKGGVGKTTLAANIANQLALTGSRVVALDIDPQNTLRLHFGIPLHDAAGFTHLLTAQPDWRTCVREVPSGILLLPYGSGGTVDAINLALAVANTPALLQRPVDDILASEDVCLVVDTPPGPSPLLAALLPRTDLLINVFLVDATSVSLIPAVERGFGHLSEEPQLSGPATGFVLNQFDPRTRLGAVIADAATQHLRDRLLGMVYRDENVAEAVAAQKLLADYAPASKASHDIAAIGRAIQHRLRLRAPADGPQAGRTGR